MQYGPDLLGRLGWCDDAEEQKLSASTDSKAVNGVDGTRMSFPVSSMTPNFFAQRFSFGRISLR